MDYMDRQIQVAQSQSLLLPRSFNSLECFTATSAELCWCSRSRFSICVVVVCRFREYLCSSGVSDKIMVKMVFLVIMGR